MTKHIISQSSPLSVPFKNAMGFFFHITFTTIDSGWIEQKTL